MAGWKLRTAEDAKRLGRAVLKIEGLKTNRSAPARPFVANPIYIGIASYDIAAASESGGTWTPGYGTAELYKLNATSGELESAQLNITVYNATESAISAGVPFCAARELGSGELFYTGSGGSNIKLGVLDNALTAGASVTVSLYSGTPGSEADSTTDVTAYDWLGLNLPSGSEVYVAQIDGNWYVVAPKTEIWRGVLDGDLAVDGTATVSLYDSSGDTGNNVTAYDWLQVALPSGTQVYVALVDNLWYVIGALEGGVKIGVLDVCLEQGGSATVSEWSGTANSETDSGSNFTAYDWLLSDNATLDVGTKVICVQGNGYWYVVGAECAPDCGCTTTTSTAASSAPAPSSSAVLTASTVKAVKATNLYNYANFR